MPSFRTLKRPATGEIEEKRSRFLCRITPVTDEEAARAVIENARKEAWDARHHCSAFILGQDGRIERSSDDGEPSGTAGAPMLDVLRGAEITNVVAVVTRWFGGTLLGAGGLVRAYSDAVRAALEDASIITCDLVDEWAVDVSHADAGKVESALRSAGFEVFDHTYTATVTLHVATTDHERLDSLIASITQGGSAPRRTGERWVTR